MHAAPPAEKCVMIDLHLAAWMHAMASGSFIGFMASEDSRHSIPFSSGVFLFACLVWRENTFIQVLSYKVKCGATQRNSVQWNSDCKLQTPTYLDWTSQLLTRDFQRCSEMRFSNARLCISSATLTRVWQMLPWLQVKLKPKALCKWISGYQGLVGR